MKKFIIKKEAKLSKAADIKIKIRLYIAILRKNIQSINALKTIAPIMMFAIVAVGVLHAVGTSQPVKGTPSPSALTSRILDNVYDKQGSDIVISHEKIKKKMYTYKANKYKQYAYVRTANLRKNR